MGFQGSVESFSLADVFQNLAMNQQSGTLRVHTPQGVERHVFISGGQVKFLSHGKEKPLLLGEIFIGRMLANEEQVKQALAKQAESGQPLGQCMTELGFLSAEQVKEVVLHQVEEETHELFAWEKAQFEFSDGPPPEGLFVDQLQGQAGGLPISHLIMEAARRVDEWERLRQQVPAFNEIYTLDPNVRQAVESGEIKLEAAERRVFSLVDGQRDVEDLIQDSFLFRFEVFSALSGFLQSSMVRPATALELGAAAVELEKQVNRRRRAKVLERQLAVGGDRPEVRRALADELAELGQNEKASIHYSVLADADFQAGRLDEAVQTYRRILQLVPNHYHSRDRLGSLYAKRGQKREALVQFQELIAAYREKGQWPDVRAFCLRALECEPQSHEVRRELIEAYGGEGNKAAAARECEVLGDQFAKLGQVRPAAEQYRKAMQFVPGLVQVKKKYDNVMLTQEDRRARNRRTLIVGGAAAGVLALAALLAHREWGQKTQFEAVQRAVQELDEQARAFEEKRQYQDAALKYQEACDMFLGLRLGERWSFFGWGRKAENAARDFRDSHDLAQKKYGELREQGQNDGRADLADGERLVGEENFFAASAAFKQVLDNTFAPDEIRRKADERKKVSDGAIQVFEEGRARMKKPPAQAFADVSEEHGFKEAYWKRFRKVPQLLALLAPLGDGAPNPEGECFYWPVKITTNVDEVGVSVDGVYKGPANRNSDNVFRYDPSRGHMLDFSRPGYRGFSVSTQNLGPTLTLGLEREPAKVRDLEESLAGTGLLQGDALWVGTANGGLHRLDAKSLERLWEFRWPTRPGLEQEIYGELRAHPGLDGKPLILFATKGGDCVAVAAGQAKPVLQVKSSEELLRVPPAIVRVTIGKEKTFFLIPTARRLRAFDLEGKTFQWPGGGSEEFPNFLSTTPLLHPDNTLFVAGCEDGNLYGIDIRSGRNIKTWHGTEQKPPMRGGLIASVNQLITGTGEGALLFFEPKQDTMLTKLQLGGTFTAAPVIQRTLLFVGTGAPDGFFGVDLERQAKQFERTRDDISGAVTTPAGLAPERVYFGTDTGRFYALKKAGKTYELLWSFSAPGGGRVVSAPLVSGNRVYFICANGKIYAFDD